MQIIDERDREIVARTFIASHAATPSPTDSPAAARYADAVSRMTDAERAEAFQLFLHTLTGLPGGKLLLDYSRSIH